MKLNATKKSRKLEMSEDDAKAWFSDKSPVELSIAQLVRDINEYVSKQPKGFRLLFMIDEVGQYVGTDTNMLLNLQSLTEKIGSECEGKVWVVCTGQEAIDEIIKVRSDEFSRIQARFKTRLSLPSFSPICFFPSLSIPRICSIFLIFSIISLISLSKKYFNLFVQSSPTGK